VTGCPVTSLPSKSRRRPLGLPANRRSLPMTSLPMDLRTVSAEEAKAEATKRGVDQMWKWGGRLFGMMLCFSMSLSSSAQEIPSPPNSGADKTLIENFAKFYLPVARTFNCKKFAWGSFVRNHELITLEYVPQGDDVNSWTRLMSITLYPLPKDTSSQIEIMNKIQGSLLGIHGKILSEEFYRSNKGYPSLFVEYEIGDGIQKEHKAGAFSTVATNTASFIQIQSRGKPFDPTDVANMKLFAQFKLPISP
jgi:hypothetical protein